MPEAQDEDDTLGKAAGHGDASPPPALFLLPAVVDGLLDLLRAALAQPGLLTELRLRWSHGLGVVAARAAARAGADPPPFPPDALPPPPRPPSWGDKRLANPAWDGQGFAALRETHWLASALAEELCERATGLTPRQRTRARFFVRQALAALSPANAPHANPAVLREALSTDGASLAAGMERLIEDVGRHGFDLPLGVPRPGALKLGQDLAATPGRVVARNRLMELIQYAPATKEVAATPLLIVPPWINKYYVLDMRPANSLIRWLVKQGRTVFLISWVNPNGQHRNLDFADYLKLGPLAALDSVERQVGSVGCDLAGYCIGGTLLGCLMAWLAAGGEAGRATSATFLTTLLDFSEPGELGAFIDERQVAAIEADMARNGYLSPQRLRHAFASLRASDLIWDPLVSDYLLARPRRAHDLLHWSADGTRLPEAMQRTYLRKFYMENRLARPDGLSMLGRRLDLSKVVTRALFVSAEGDRIAPWRSTLHGARLPRGGVRFLLASGGHVTGIVNPPSAGRGSWRAIDLAGFEDCDQAQLLVEGSPPISGSWWPEWSRWLSEHDDGAVAARDPDRGQLAVLGAAPGGYVRVVPEEAP